MALVILMIYYKAVAYKLPFLQSSTLSLQSRTGYMRLPGLSPPQIDPDHVLAAAPLDGAGAGGQVAVSADVVAADRRALRRARHHQLRGHQLDAGESGSAARVPAGRGGEGGGEGGEGGQQLHHGDRHH